MVEERYQIIFIVDRHLVRENEWENLACAESVLLAQQYITKHIDELAKRREVVYIRGKAYEQYGGSYTFLIDGKEVVYYITPTKLLKEMQYHNVFR